ncbi:hypothetical protein ACFP47_02370 [Nesterenkonia lacusekhoensis]|uniref:WXG100 family type VII secretion target n=1 Tax=Nesterenkonia lacusekhoensis TaxID=150832 RepID=A0ABS4T4H0_9MICC|nr:hypothetical protein [Nesterenkonia lacusekhoensis]MBP2318864.1 hypothetical protein [Nesterenkonia lacusekhoensis]
MLSYAATELDRTASVYEEMAAALGRVDALAGPYDSAVARAEGCAWDSSAGEAFSAAVGFVRGEGVFVGGEAAELAQEARTIAGELREAAELARTVAHLVGAAVGVAVDLLPDVVTRAADAVGDPVSFIRFLEEHGGVPPVLYTLEELISSLPGTD